MKAFTLAFAIGAAAYHAVARDGIFVASSIVDGLRQYIYDVDGTTKLATASGAVQFLYNGGVVGNGVYGFLAPGTFSGGYISIPNMAGENASITIEIWDKTTGSTYEQAMISGHYMPTQTIRFTLGGGGGGVPSPPSELYGFTGGKLIVAPEPSKFALAVLGLGGLLFVSRR